MSTAIVGIILAVIVIFVIGKMIKNKKEGKGSCGCSCQGCTMKDNCHPKE